VFAANQSFVIFANCSHASATGDDDLGALVKIGLLFFPDDVFTKFWQDSGGKTQPWLSDATMEQAVVTGNTVCQCQRLYFVACNAVAKYPNVI